MIVQVPKDHWRYEKSKSAGESLQHPKKILMCTSSRIAVQIEMAAQPRSMSRYPRDLQDREYSGERGKIPAVYVRPADKYHP